MPSSRAPSSPRPRRARELGCALSGLALGVGVHAGCSEGAPTPSTPGELGSSGEGGPGTRAPMVAITSALEDAGFAHVNGRFEFIDLARCCDPGQSCFGNNPSSPYARIMLPAATDQVAINPGTSAEGLAPAWRLRQDEAVLLVGMTPPRAQYFGLTTYLFDRRSDEHAGTRETLFASLGDSLNHGTIALPGAPDPFGRPFVALLVANETTRANVKAALEVVGISPAVVNEVPLAGEGLRFGLGDEADTFSFLMRVAKFDDGAAGARYIANPGGAVLRLTPRAAVGPSPATAPALRPRGTGSSERALEPAVARLERAIKARYRELAARDLEVTNEELYGEECISEGLNCNGDTRDTVYAISKPFVLPQRDDTFVMVYGVNHQATGKATYSNFIPAAMRHLVGIAAVDSGAFAGSARVYLPDDPDADELYAWKVARRCTGEPYCLEVPAECPGLPLAGLGFLMFRIYLEPTTHTAPSASELVLDRALRFGP